MTNCLYKGAVKTPSGITSTQLKYIAMASMLIDHIGAILIEPLLKDLSTLTPLLVLYVALRAVGRIAFPLYVFLLVEGFAKTHDSLCYLNRLTIFAIISEIPYDLGFNNTTITHPLEFDSQNVFFTLALGLCMLRIFEHISAVHASKLITFLLYLITIAGTSLCAELAHTDYSWYGILAIAVAHLTKTYLYSEHQYGLIVLTLVLLDPLELFALTAMPVVQCYIGKKGTAPNKYLFYAFYPLHILVLCIIRHLCF